MEVKETAMWFPGTEAFPRWDRRVDALRAEHAC